MEIIEGEVSRQDRRATTLAVSAAVFLRDFPRQAEAFRATPGHLPLLASALLLATAFPPSDVTL